MYVYYFPYLQPFLLGAYNGFRPIKLYFSAVEWSVLEKTPPLKTTMLYIIHASNVICYVPGTW